MKGTVNFSAKALAVIFLGACTAETVPDSGPARPANVVLIVVDTLRMDHTSLDGYERDTTPFLAELVSDGATSFSQFRASAPWTKPSVASLFTGLDPLGHGVLQHPDRLHSSYNTLAEVYQKAGYQTAGFQTNLLLSSAFGFDQGFDSYNENHLVGHSQSTGAELNGAVAKWLDDERDPELPYFLYIHHFEPHFDYLRSGEEWVANYDGPLTGSESMEQLIGATDKLRNEEFRFLASRYDAEIKYQDQLLRELWGEFGSRSLQDDVVLVITADHGEEFGDHGDLAHQYKMYDELLRVPLVIRSGIDTGLVFAPGEEQRPQGLRDLGATLLRLTGVAPNFHGQPFALEGSLKREVSEYEPSLAHTIYFDDLRQARRREMLVSGDWKLIRQEGGAGHPERVQLFHLSDDPSEKHNRAEELPDVVRKLESELRAKLLRNEEVFQPDRKPEATQLSDELLQRLADLGYL